MTAATGSAHPCVTELVVAGALIGIRKHSVRFRDFLEALFRRRVIRIPVGMALHRELAVGLLQVRLGDTPVDPERLVIVPLTHNHSSRLRGSAGRRASRTTEKTSQREAGRRNQGRLVTARGVSTQP